MRTSSVSAFLCLFAAALCLCACGPRKEIPHVKEETFPQVEDPILQQTVPGAYGVPGGDVVLGEGWQYACMRYHDGQRQNFRLAQPSTARVVSLSGLPCPLVPGRYADTLYRSMEGGFTRVCLPYRLQVLWVQDGKVWLKESDRTFFVVEQ